MFNLRKSIIPLTLAIFPMMGYAEPTKLNIWWGERGMIDILHEIDQEMDDIEIEIKVMRTSEMNNEFIKASSSGNSVPDIINVDNPFNSWLADKDLLLSLDEYIAQSDVFNIDDFYDGSKSVVTWKDKIYGVPNTINTIVLFYNKEDYREVGLDPENPPQTWDELYEAAKKLTNPEKNRYGLFFSAIATEEGVFQLLPWIQMTGANWDDINQEGTVEALNYLKRFIDEGLSSKDVLIQTQDPASFVSRQASMMIIGPWALKDVRSSGIDWGTAILPVNPKYNIRASALGGFNMSIPAKSAHADAAFRFIEAVEKKQSRLWNEAGYLSPRKDVVTENPKDPKAYDTLIEQLQYAKPRGPHPEWNKVSKALTQMFQDVLIGKSTPEKAVERAEKSINKAIQ